MATKKLKMNLSVKIPPEDSSAVDQVPGAKLSPPSRAKQMTFPIGTIGVEDNKTMEQPFIIDTIEEGDKATYPMSGSYVLLNYSAYVLNRDPDVENEMFESDITKRMCVGKGRIISGLDESLQQLSKGTSANITIRSDHGFGTRGLADLVPPNADLLFTVKVLDIKSKQEQLVAG